MILYHATTEKKAKQYRILGRINPPIRGFSTLTGAMYWAMKVGRKVIYEVEVENIIKLPDHHNEYGIAFWSEKEATVDKIKCVVSPK